MTRIANLTPLPAAVAASALAALAGALQSVIWHGPTAPGWARAVAAAIEPGLLAAPAAAALASPGPAYFAHGRVAVAIYALLWLAAPRVAARAEVRGARWFAAGLGVALVGDVLAYWVSAAAGPGVRRIGFLYLEVPALGAIALAATAIGVARLRRGAPGGELAAAVPLSIAGAAALRYAPHGVLLGLGATCALALAAPGRAVAASRGAR